MGRSGADAAQCRRRRAGRTHAAAHELLHAAYARLDPLERSRVDALVADATAGVSATDPVHEQIDWSVGDHEDNRANEQFAYLGSQIWPQGGFAPELETIYARCFTDRAALVAAHHRAGAIVDDAIAASNEARAAVADDESRHAREQAQLAADQRGYDAAAADYAADVAQFEATPASERPRWQVTLQPPGEAPITMS